MSEKQANNKAENSGAITEHNVIQSTQQWLTSIVIELNLCPFAQREYRQERIRFQYCDASSEEALLQALLFELQTLLQYSEYETSLLIHPHILQSFTDYNQFLGLADELLESIGLSGDIQIASFHPHYQFADTAADDVENYTNRSPYPMLHLLRETSVERAIAQHPNTQQIPDDNIMLMQKLGVAEMAKRLSDCYEYKKRGR